MEQILSEYYAEKIRDIHMYLTAAENAFLELPDCIKCNDQRRPYSYGFGTINGREKTPEYYLKTAEEAVCMIAATYNVDLHKKGEQNNES